MNPCRNFPVILLVERILQTILAVVKGKLSGVPVDHAVIHAQLLLYQPYLPLSFKEK